MSAHLAAATALRLTEIIAGAGVVITSAELLAEHRDLADASLNSWSVLRLAHRATTSGPLARLLSAVLGYPQVLAVIGLRLLAALVIMAVPIIGPPHTAMLALVTVTLIMVGYRTPHGGEGADQVLMIVFVTLTLVALHTTALTRDAGLWAIAAQAALAYFTSGCYKLGSREWVNGTCLLAVLATTGVGKPPLADWLSARPRLVAWGARGMIAAEVLFPTVLLAPAKALPVYLAAGLLFHLSCALIIGLNVFPLAFGATYPAIAFAVLSR